MRRWGIPLSIAVAWLVGSFAGSAYGEAWLHGIPGDTTPGGIRVEVVTPPAGGRVTLTLKTDDRLSHTLHTLLKNKNRLNELRLVLRKDPKSKMDVVYTLGSITVSSIKSGPAQAQSVDLTFTNVESRMLLSANPGPPVGAPAVQATGINTGWIHLSESSAMEGIAVDVVGFTPSEGSGLLRVVFAGDQDWRKVQRLLQARKSLGLLILVLPDRENRRYVEYKLSDAIVASRKPITYSPNEKGFVNQEVVFKSHMTEYLIGEDSFRN